MAASGAGRRSCRHDGRSDDLLRPGTESGAGHATGQQGRSSKLTWSQAACSLDWFAGSESFSDTGFSYAMCSVYVCFSMSCDSV